jgi:hypothetical protein
VHTRVLGENRAQHSTVCDFETTQFRISPNRANTSTLDTTEIINYYIRALKNAASTKNMHMHTESIQPPFLFSLRQPTLGVTESHQYELDESEVWRHHQLQRCVLVKCKVFCKF